MIRITNYTDDHFDGWVRLTTDEAVPDWSNRPPHPAVNEVVAGLPNGLDTREIDVHVTLRGQETVSFEPSHLAPAPPPFPRGRLPDDPRAFFGGLPSIGSYGLQLLTVVPSGAGYDVHFHGRVLGGFVADLWLTWYPDEPGLASGELVLTASDCRTPQLTYPVAATQQLRFGTATVFGLVPPGFQRGEELGDGQARGYPVCLVWFEHLVNWSSAKVAAKFGICANGIVNLYLGGNPMPRRDANHAAWVHEHLPAAIAHMSDWGRDLGPAENSSVTGAQEDQVFPGAELTCLGAERIRYLTALGMLRRPCHHLEADGSLLVLARHPQLVFWDGRPHFNSNVSPDRLGKARNLDVSEAHGWWGPDVEHALFQTEALAARVTGSRALQWDHEHWARIYLLQWTARPGLGTSQTYAARAVLWEALLAIALWRGLRDRTLAEQVKARWLERARLILVPQLGAAAGGIWDPRRDDRLGPGPWWMPYQQAMGSYGLDLAGEVFGDDRAREVALRAALTVLDKAWANVDGYWVAVPVEPVPGPEDATAYGGMDLLMRRLAGYTADELLRVDPCEWCTLPRKSEAVPTGSTPDASFNDYGMPLGIATILRHDPQHVVALQIWKHLVASPNASGKWFPPEVPR